MRTLIIAVAAGVFLVAPCCAQTTVTFGEATGSPGESVSFSLSIDPRQDVSDFQGAFTYDRNFLLLDSIDLSNEAWDNGIQRLNYIDNPPGTVTFDTESYDWWLEDISRLAILKFVISSTAFSTTTEVAFKGEFDYELDNSGGWDVPDSTKNGIITIVGPPHPGGKAPQVNLRMESSSTVYYGETPVVHYNIQANDWAEYVVEVYLAVITPTGKMFFIDNKNNLYLNPHPVTDKFSIKDTSGNIATLPVPDTAPEGTYSIDGVLVYRGKSPLDSNNWVSNLGRTHFNLIKDPAAAR